MGAGPGFRDDSCDGCSFPLRNAEQTISPESVQRRVLGREVIIEHFTCANTTESYVEFIKMFSIAFDSPYTKSDQSTVSKLICQFSHVAFAALALHILVPKLCTIKKDVSGHFHTFWAEVASIALAIEMNGSCKLAPALYATSVV